MRHLMSPLDFSVEELDKLLDLAEDIEANPKKYAHACEGKKLATLFYEPSTRTRLSHEAAMLNLGGSIMGFSSADSSSAAKGESVSDTIRTISCYADICAMRHPKEGAPMVACQHSSIPVINAGDGGHQHPTQTLTDLMTIRSLKGHLGNMTIGLCGDLKFGRTVHSADPRAGALSGHEVCADLTGGAETSRLHPPRCAGEKSGSLRGGRPPGGGSSKSGSSLHDPRAEGALLQRGGLCAHEGITGKLQKGQRLLVTRTFIIWLWRNWPVYILKKVSLMTLIRH